MFGQKSPQIGENATHDGGIGNGNKIHLQGHRGSNGLLDGELCMVAPPCSTRSECSVFVLVCKGDLRHRHRHINILRVNAVLNVVFDKGDPSLANGQNHIRVALPAKDCLTTFVIIIIIMRMVGTWSALMRFLARSTSTWISLLSGISPCWPIN